MDKNEKEMLGTLREVLAAEGIALIEGETDKNFECKADRTEGKTDKNLGCKADRTGAMGPDAALVDEMDVVAFDEIDTALVDEMDAISVIESATLYITDNGKWAQSLVAEGGAVLVYLHEGNREQSFAGIKYACESLGDMEPEYLERVYRRYQRIPWDILETKRCLLRESIEADVDAFYEIYKEPSITAYMENLFADREEQLAYIKDYREKVYEFYGFGIWTVIKKDTGEVIGRAGCSYREGFEDPELGFVIGVPWQRQGYAEEVCRGILEYAREYLGFSKIQAFVREGNQASLRLCEKLGMRGEPISIEEKEYIVVGGSIWKKEF